MNLKLKVKKAYVGFIEKEKKNKREALIFFALYCLSLIYGFVVFFRNVFYDLGFLSRYKTGKKVISVGNISWGGCGKTSLVRYLYHALSGSFRVAAVTKGYARDEFLLLKDEIKVVYDAKDRVSLLKKLAPEYDLFILDDGFQYRKARRDIDIVIMTDKEFKGNACLLPAYILREPLASLKRADIVILNHSQNIDNIKAVRQRLFKINPKLRVYSAGYKYRRLVNRDKQPVDISYLRKKKCAVLTAIGYPQGFVDLVNKLGIRPAKVISYPDHFEFPPGEVVLIEKGLNSDGIKDIIITYKDFYHIDLSRARLNYFILEADLDIEAEDEFFKNMRFLLSQQ
ncbi:MAG: tetraacyldisaccharide 4'-kinase [Candidatus Omnitrophota bacterium]